MINAWVSFPGGELQAQRPRALCQACRERLNRLKPSEKPGRAASLCFQCYRADLERTRALEAAANLHTASEERFQVTLPFEPVNVPRLKRLKAERSEARAALAEGVGRFTEARRRAQIAARHALQQIARLSNRPQYLKHLENLENLKNPENFENLVLAAELQLPNSWLPYVVGNY